MYTCNFALSKFFSCLSMKFHKLEITKAYHMYCPFYRLDLHHNRHPLHKHLRKNEKYFLCICTFVLYQYNSNFPIFCWWNYINKNISALTTRVVCLTDYGITVTIVIHCACTWLNVKCLYSIFIILYCNNCSSQYWRLWNSIN